MSTIPQHQAMFEKIVLEATETKVFRFRLVPPHDENFSFTVGQFLSLKIQEKVFRAYSFASLPEELPYFELCAKFIPNGLGSTYLKNLTPGDMITFRGPFGRFGIHDPEKNKIFIATGSGIAPVKAFVDELNRNRLRGQHELLFGNYTAGHMAYAEYFQKTASERNDFSCHFYLSNPEKGDLEKLDSTKGMVTDYLREKSASYFHEKDVYICGSPPMVKDVIRILTEEKNFPKERIFTEAYY